jgi:hypothetical protein
LIIALSCLGAAATAAEYGLEIVQTALPSLSSIDELLSLRQRRPPRLEGNRQIFEKIGVPRRLSSAARGYQRSRDPALDCRRSN